jgi:predicted MPP superfamily phosphohydrolase
MVGIQTLTLTQTQTQTRIRIRHPVRTTNAPVTLLPLAIAGGVAVAGVSWGFAEARAYTVRRVDVPILAPGSKPIRVLHVSDLHLTPGQRAKVAWVRSLADESPDLVVNTGDNLAHMEAVPSVLEAFEPLFEVPGVFVHGSNDYFAPRPKNPFGYFRGPSRVKRRPHRLPTRALTQGFEDRGWVNLNNRRGSVEAAGRTVTLVGMDDPHVERDRMPESSNERGDLHLGVVHAPYRRALEALLGDGAALALAGHTHGGQVCVPGFGALVTNCDLDTRRVKGLHGWPGRRPDFENGADGMWLHVSAGIGTSPYVRVRFACRPEATMLTLVEKVV